MNKQSLAAIFHKKLLKWILLPGIFFTIGIVLVIGFNHTIAVQGEIIQLSKSLSKNVDFYMDGAEDILQSVALMPNTEEASYHDLFNRMHEEFQQFERIIMVDEDGNIVASAPERNVGADFPIHFKHDIKEEHILSSPVISPHSGTMVVFLGVPVKGGGNIVAELSLDALQDFLFSFLTPDRILILTDPYGNIVVHPDKTLVQTQANIGDLEILRDIDSSQTAQFYSHNDEIYYGYASRIPHTGWKLLVSCPIDALLTSSISWGLFTGIILIFFFILLTIGVKREFNFRVINPLVSYINRLSAVAEGNYPTFSSQEIGFKELNEFGKVFDVMSRKVMERERDLKVSRAYLQNVIDSMPSALIRVDDKMNLCQWNRKAFEIYSELSQEDRLIPVEDFFKNEPDILRAISDARELNIPRILERRSLADSPLSLYDITVFPLQNSDLQGVVVRMDDVTSKSRMEEVMVQTEKMMSVGGLAAGMAHEINNPLGGILQGAQNLVRRFRPDIKANVQAASRVGCSIESLQNYLDERKILAIIDGIRESGLRASSIVSNMLEFSKPGRDIVGLVNVAELINNSLELAAKDYDLKKKYDFLHVKIVREFDPDLPDILCSRTEIEQVLFNLFKNAAQAMSEHGHKGDEPTIHVRTIKLVESISIEVEDNGPGIDPEARRRVFEPFYTTKSTDSGTGLGLSVSYFIITQNHGGSFIVDSHSGSGAKFTITLPLKKS